MCDTQGEASAVAATRGPWMLQMGYWSDAMEAAGNGPDVFFIVVEDESEFLQCAEMLLEAWYDKYGVGSEIAEHGYLATFDRNDLFWSCAPRPS